MILYILNYNNYYNRLFKKEDTLIDYLDYIEAQIPNVNFNPNDDIRTTQIINSNGKGDYAILSDGTNIISRWFILESTRQRNGQYRLDLKRDLVIDNYDKIINSPCFIERAILGDNDPMIFNSEGMTFNQIKTKETLLKDETKCPWIVAYIAKDQELTAEYTDNFAGADIVVENISDYKYYNYSNLSPTPSVYNKLSDVVLGVGLFNTNEDVYGAKIECAFNGTGYVNLSNAYSNGYTNLISAEMFTEIANDQLTANIRSFPDKNIPQKLSEKASGQWESIERQYSTYTGESWALPREDGLLIYETSTQKTYKVTQNKILSTIKTVHHIIGGEIYDTLNNIVSQINDIEGTAGNLSYSSLAISNEQYTFNMEEVFVGNKIDITISKDRYKCNDSPYDIVCIPFGRLNVYSNGQYLLQTDERVGFATAMALANKYSSESAKYVYDLQLVPYCPVRYCIKEDDTFDVGIIGTSKFTTIDMHTSDTQTKPLSVAIYASSSAFTFDISHKIEITDYKEQSQTDMWRLCSPNYNGQFEFNAAMNYGVDYFNVDVTYKPYQPYIHINPNFKGLFGKDYNDSRGLICGGDFSLPIVTDAWESYQLANKNYEQIFNRQIQNMKVQQKVQRTQDIIGVATGTLTGAGAGFMVGGPVGAVIGGIASAAGGAADIALNETLRREQISYATDMWDYQLGNIQALPDSLSKTTAYTYNNKIFPILEYYTCTDREKNALNDKIKYNSMNVGRIGKIVDFLQPDYSFVKAKLIRLEGTNNDSQYISEIANELSKGVFIK